MNARSLRNKLADIFDFVCECKLNLLAITETWLNANDDAVRNELCPINYKLYDQPRTDRTGGGRNSSSLSRLTSCEKDRCRRESSLRKHPFLLALRRWGRSPAVKSEEKRMFSQASEKESFEFCEWIV